MCPRVHPPRIGSHGQPSCQWSKGLQEAPDENGPVRFQNSHHHQQRTG